MNSARSFSLAVFTLTAAFGFLFAFALRSHNSAQAIPDPDNFAPNYHYDGITLASAPTSPSDDTIMLTRLLDAQLWTFATKTSRANMDASYEIVVMEEGKPVRVIGSLRSRCGDIKTEIPHLSYLRVGMVPLDQQGWAQSNKIKYSIGISGAAASGVIDNPLKGAFQWGTANSESTGKNIPLLSARLDDGPAKARDITLALRVKTNPN